MSPAVDIGDNLFIRLEYLKIVGYTCCTLFLRNHGFANGITQLKSPLASEGFVPWESCKDTPKVYLCVFPFSRL